MKLDKFMCGLLATQAVAGALEAYSEIQDDADPHLTAKLLLKRTDRYSLGLLLNAAETEQWVPFNKMLDTCEPALRLATYEERCQMWNYLRSR